MIRELADLEHYLDLANKATLHGLPGETKAENLVAHVPDDQQAGGPRRERDHRRSRRPVSSGSKGTPPASGGCSTTAATTVTMPPAGGVWPCGCGTTPWPSRRCRTGRITRPARGGVGRRPPRRRRRPLPGPRGAAGGQGLPEAVLGLRDGRHLLHPPQPAPRREGPGGEAGPGPVGARLPDLRGLRRDRRLDAAAGLHDLAERVPAPDRPSLRRRRRRSHRTARPPAPVR